MLNYLLPLYLYKGIGQVLLNKIENAAHELGLKKISAVSTITAKNFYEKNGFIKNGEPGLVGDVVGDFPLIKYLM